MEKLLKDRYQNVVSMLKSPDKENHVMALSILDQMDFKSNLCAILLCKKHGNAPFKSWQENAPKISKELGELDGFDPNKSITFKKILTILAQEKVDPEQMDFFLDDFGGRLLEQIRFMGYDFIEDIEMNIKLKESYAAPG